MPGGSFTALAIGKSGLGNRNRKYRGPERLDKKKRPGPSALHGSSGLKALIGASKKALNNERATYRIKRVRKHGITHQAQNMPEHTLLTRHYPAKACFPPATGCRPPRPPVLCRRPSHLAHRRMILFNRCDNRYGKCPPHFSVFFFMQAQNPGI